MILYAETIFITASVIVILGGLVYLLHKPRKGDSSEGDESQKPHSSRGDPDL